jgi:hypothetical protein
MGWMHAIDQGRACKRRTRPVLVAARPPRGAGDYGLCNIAMLEVPGQDTPHANGPGAAAMPGDPSCATEMEVPAAWASWSKASIKRALGRLRKLQRSELGLQPCRCAQGCVCNADIADTSAASCKEDEAGAAGPSGLGQTPHAADAAATGLGSCPQPPPQPVLAAQPVPPPRLVPRVKKLQKRPNTEAGRS